MRGNQRLNFQSQFAVVVRNLLDVDRPLSSPETQRLVQNRAYLFPSFRSHGGELPLISRYSQALATVQSRSTVATETPRNFAVSSRERPPKNLNSKIRLWRGFIWDNCLRASSSASKSTLFDTDSSAASSRVTRLPPSLFAALRLRA